VPHHLGMPPCPVEAVRTSEHVSTADSDGGCIRFGPAEGATEAVIEPMDEMPHWGLHRDLFYCSDLVTWDSSLEPGRFVG
jgi:hypothetical protein